METNSDKPNASVAVFDSGIGGLNLLKECARALPAVKFYYLADNFNVPYGTKKKDEIFSLVKSKLDVAASKGISAAVIACNTATSNCIEELRAVYSFPIVGIQPAVKPAVKIGGRCLVLATEATVNSASFKQLISRFDDKDITVYPCAGLAEYIEKNLFTLNENFPAELLPNVEADSVVLGCTHYVFIKDIVQRRYNCPVFDGIAGTADHLREILGMSDHQQGNIGISDHNTDKQSNVTFLSGDIVKNTRIYNYIISRKGNCSRINKK